MISNCFGISKLKALTCLLIVISLLVLFAGGCSQSETTTPPQESGDTETQPKSEQKDYQPVEFNLCHFMPPMHPLHSNVLVPWAEEIEQKTDGQSKNLMFMLQTSLAAADKNYDATLSGVIDIGLVLPAYTPGLFPLTSILEFPFMFDSPLQANLTAWDLVQMKIP
jgi:TRAP-type C4-dicarboxylate transport system substrate-binding protein